MKTTCVKTCEVTKNWHLIDAQGIVLGRLASKIATLLRGKTKATFTPNMDTGDCVVVINAEKVALTSNKAKTKKFWWHTGFIGGIKSISIGDRLQSKNAHMVIQDAVKGMLPKGPLGYKTLGNLYVYAGEQHKHGAQQPVAYDFASENRKNRV